METAEKITGDIIADEYLRERFAPKFGDPLYHHLSDLRVALEYVRTDQPVRMLDYGCGGSPYRGLFPNADYRRADYLATTGLDYVLSADSKVEERSEYFDVVLSTQTLEHVQQPQTYLGEAYRLLKPGGVFICTTHGTYEEHGCPYDYHRWTADGLREECKKTGFDVDQVLKLTTGPRAMMFLMELYRERFSGLPNDPLGNAFRDILRAIHFQQAQFHEWNDAAFPEHRVTESMDREHAFYVALLLIGRKPEMQTASEGFRYTPHSVIKG